MKRAHEDPVIPSVNARDDVEERLHAQISHPQSQVEQLEKEVSTLHETIEIKTGQVNQLRTALEKCVVALEEFTSGATKISLSKTHDALATAKPLLPKS